MLFRSSNFVATSLEQIIFTSEVVFRLPGVFLFIFLKIILFYFWLRWVLVAAHRIFVEACGIFCSGMRASL